MLLNGVLIFYLKIFVKLLKFKT